MSSVFLQVGQCGNQIGQQFWKKVVSKEADQDHVFTTRDGKLRAIAVDSEPKVVGALLKDLKKSGSSSFRESNIVLGQGGRGSNWAMGYYGGGAGSEGDTLEMTLEALRREAERCEVFSGTVMMHSLCGGTGSGLGSRVCQAIREEFAVPYLLSVVAAPHSSGESPLQNYNSLLCLSSLQRHSDAVLLFSNDHTLHRLQKGAKPGAGRHVSLADMNAHMAACLAGVLAPISCLSPPSTGCSIGCEPWELIRSVCPMASCKFAHLTHLSRKALTWDKMGSQLTQTLPRHTQSKGPLATLSALVVARGDRSNSFGQFSKVIGDRVKSCCNCVEWNPFPVDFWVGPENPLSSAPGLSSLTLCTNSSIIIDSCTRILSKARKMYDSKAFLHWYYRYGCLNEDFETAFETVEGIVENYTDALKP